MRNKQAKMKGRIGVNKVIFLLIGWFMFYFDVQALVNRGKQTNG